MGKRKRVSASRDVNAARCDMLQCVAVCRSVLQWAGMGCSGLLWVAVGCSGLQWVVVRCSVLQCVAVHCSALQCPLTEEIRLTIFGCPDQTGFPLVQVSDGDSRVLP